ncbi:MAG: hypothetical protein ACRD5B_17750 [Nitrososphaeraceae archaeon]
MSEQNRDQKYGKDKALEPSAISKSKYRICNAANCYQLATEEVEVSAGIFGKLRFDLCGECSVRFEQ